MTTWITICETCRLNGWVPGDISTTDGERLAALVEAAAQGTDVRTRRHPCLMGCSQGCNVAIQAEGKMAYTLGRLDPDSATAAAIVAYARHHATSDSGVVPWRDWPERIKAHFVTRHPPLPR
ncbi:DUF1636 family protein [Oceaniovalibus guishaninsula]|nr:DUF1636 domain-containing protein [Oceaniovalibus guishaninsula]